MLSQDLFTAIVEKQQSNQRFASLLNKQTTERLSEFAAWLRKEIYARDSIFGGNKTKADRKRLEALLSKVEKKAKGFYVDLSEFYLDELNGLSDDEAKFITAALNEDLTKAAAISKPSNSKIWFSVLDKPLYFADDKNNKYYSPKEMVADLGVKADQIVSVIKNGFSEGRTVQQVVSDIVGTRDSGYRNGLIDGSRREAETVVRTLTNHVSAQARKDVYEANDDVIYGYRLVAVIDVRTSNTCKRYDGMVIKNGASFQPRPPFHPNCRTVDVPEVRSEFVKDESKTRAVNFIKRGDVKGGKVGQVSSTKTYLEVLKDQPAGQQDLAFNSKTLGKIFRNSGVTVEEFREVIADKMGRPLDLAQMAKRNEKILNYMKQSREMRKYLGD